MQVEVLTYQELQDCINDKYRLKTIYQAKSIISEKVSTSNFCLRIEKEKKSISPYFAKEACLYCYNDNDIIIIAKDIVQKKMIIDFLTS